jgi:hypothetical protein
MMNKYSTRSLPAVIKADEVSIERVPAQMPTWYNDFVSNLQMNSTSAQSSLYDDINAILGNAKPKFSSVEEAVKDLKERTGLDQVMNARSIVAFIQEPSLFKTVPELKIFIDNFVGDRPGTSVESVVHELLKIDSIRNKLPISADVDDEVRAYINRKIAESNSKNTDLNKVDMHIGKVDQTNQEAVVDDPLALCEPTK